MWMELPYLFISFICLAQESNVSERQGKSHFLTLGTNAFKRSVTSALLKLPYITRGHKGRKK